MMTAFMPGGNGSPVSTQIACSRSRSRIGFASERSERILGSDRRAVHCRAVVVRVRDDCPHRHGCHAPKRFRDGYILGVERGDGADPGQRLIEAPMRLLKRNVVEIHLARHRLSPSQVEGWLRRGTGLTGCFAFPVNLVHPVQIQASRYLEQ